MKNFIKFWKILPNRRKKHFWLILLLIIASSLVEIISIGAVLPFLGALTNPAYIYENSFIQPLILLLDLKSPVELLLPITVIFIIAAMVAGIIRLVLLYIITKFSYSLGAEISLNVYRATLYQPYSFHLGVNSSDIINSVVTKVNAVITGIILPVLVLISSFILLVGLMIAMLYVDTSVALISFLCFSIVYIGIIYFSKVKIKKNSRVIAIKSTQIIKSLQEGLGNIRDVLVDSSQEFYCKLYRNSDVSLRQALGSNNFISTSPRFLVESIGMSLIAVLAYFLSQREGGMNVAIPILGALALGAQRMLPAFQQIYSSIATIKGVEASFNDVISLLSQDIIKAAIYPVMPFEKNIRLKKVGFFYPKSATWVFSNLDIVISKGSRTGIMGATGDGKSTLIDIIMALQESSFGELLIDGNKITTDNRNNWQMNLAHVPQNIYLSDSSIEENIALGIHKHEIDHERIQKSAEQAQISRFIEGLSDGYKTQVGEGGARLSGGQRQRIGIARALYKRASVLIFDEATSALDENTENELMKAINALDENLTIIIVAHRLSTLKDCNQIIKLDKGAVTIGSYGEIVSNINHT